MVIQTYAPTSNAEEAEVECLWRPTRPFRTNIQKDVLFIIGDWNANVEVKKHLEWQVDLALEYGMKQGKD